MPGSLYSKSNVLHKLDLGLTPYSNNAAIPHLVTHKPAAALCTESNLNCFLHKGVGSIPMESVFSFHFDQNTYKVALAPKTLSFPKVHSKFLSIHMEYEA